MIALGIDGGSRRAGVAVMRHTPHAAPELLYAGLVRMDVVPWTDRLASERVYLLFTRTAELVREWRPDLVCIEKIRVRGGGAHRNLDSYLVGAQAQEAAIVGALFGADQAALPQLRVIEALAVQVRSRLRIKARKSEAAKTEARRRFNREYDVELGLCGFAAAADGPVPETMTDVTDAIALAAAAPFFVAGDVPCPTPTRSRKKR